MMGLVSSWIYQLSHDISGGDNQGDAADVATRFYSNSPPDKVGEFAVTLRGLINCPIAIVSI